MDAWMGIAAVIVGLVTCFYGYPLFRILLILAGLIVGYGLGQTVVQTGHPWLSLTIGAIAALALAAFAYPFWSIGVTISGAVLGFLILSAIGAALNVSQAVIFILGALGAIIIGALFYQARDLFVMLTTALNGAVEVAFGLGWLFPALAFRRGASNILALVVIVVLGAMGLAVQYGMFKERRTYSATPPAQEVR
jgi:hypothetical protein